MKNGDKTQMTVDIYATIIVALKKDKKFAEEQFNKSNGAYWQGLIKEIDIAIEYVKEAPLI